MHIQMHFSRPACFRRTHHGAEMNAVKLRSAAESKSGGGQPSWLNRRAGSASAVRSSSSNDKTMLCMLAGGRGAVLCQGLLIWREEEKSQVWPAGLSSSIVSTLNTIEPLSRTRSYFNIDNAEQTSC